MNPLTLLPLLAAAAMAAPGVQLLSHVAPVATHYAAPLTAQVHYQHTPVVTGYQSTVLKPALAHAPLALQGIAIARQIPDLPTNPAPPADVPNPAPNNTTPQPPIGDLPQIPGQGSENGTGSDSPLPAIPGVPGGVVLLNNANPQLYSVAVPQIAAVQQVAAVRQVAVPQVAVPQVAVQQVAVAPQVVAPQIATVRAAQAGDFEPLVTKEKVLAPVRTHTQITPQLTQIQPEIQVRRVIQDVPVAAPIAIQQPVWQQVVV